MYLSDRDISWALDHGLRVEPLLTPIQPASIDVRLGHHVIHLSGGLVDRHKGIIPHEVVEPITKALVLPPGKFVLVALLEHIVIPDSLVGVLVGKSSWARLGLQVESAGYIDPGYEGNPTLELKNLGPYMVRLWPEEPIAQLRLAELSCHPARRYGDPDLNSHYQGAELPQSAAPESPAQAPSKPEQEAPPVPAEQPATPPSSR
jgi:dCTP deaminase